MSRKREVKSQREIDDLASFHLILKSDLIYMSEDMNFVVDASGCRFTAYSDDLLITFRNISRIVLQSLSEAHECSMYPWDVGVCMDA